MSNTKDSYLLIPIFFCVCDAGTAVTAAAAAVAAAAPIKQESVSSLTKLLKLGARIDELTFYPLFVPGLCLSRCTMLVVLALKSFIIQGEKNRFVRDEINEWRA